VLRYLRYRDSELLLALVFEVSPDICKARRPLKKKGERMLVSIASVVMLATEAQRFRDGMNDGVRK
jgi:hypothetical protein